MWRRRKGRKPGIPDLCTRRGAELSGRSPGDRQWGLGKDDGVDLVLDLILQGSVHCPGRCLSVLGQLSYQVKIDLCEVNLTRVQLTETCEA
jgi:hypothetical protein